MSYLPAQEDANETCYQRGIALAIERLSPEDPEAAVTGIWVMILGFALPALGGYLVRPEQITPGGVADLFMVHFNMAVRPIREYHFFIVQCKVISAEWSASTWADARQQLRDYLPDHKPRNRRHRVYGAVAIGRWVEFYEYSRTAAAAGQDPLLKVNNRGRLHIARQCRTIMGILNQIRANHN